MSATRHNEQLRELAVRMAAIVWLVGVWLLLWGEVTPLIVLTGVLVAVSVIVFLPLPKVPVDTRVRIGPLIVLALIIARELVISSLQVAWYAVRPAPIPPGGIHWVKFRMSSDLVLALAILALTLIPGTVVLAIDRVHRRVQVHLIPSRNKADVKKFEEQAAKLEHWFGRAFERRVGK